MPIRRCDRTSNPLDHHLKQPNGYRAFFPPALGLLMTNMRCRRLKFDVLRSVSLPANLLELKEGVKPTEDEDQAFFDLGSSIERFCKAARVAIR